MLQNASTVVNEQSRLKMSQLERYCCLSLEQKCILLALALPSVSYRTLISSSFHLLIIAAQWLGCSGLKALSLSSLETKRTSLID